jgi:hypothetical protein
VHLLFSSGWYLQTPSMNVPHSIRGNIKIKFYNTHCFHSYKWSHIYHGCTKFDITLPTNQSFLSRWNLHIKITSQYKGIEHATSLSIHQRSNHMASLSIHYVEESWTHNWTIETLYDSRIKCLMEWTAVKTEKTQVCTSMWLYLCIKTRDFKFCCISVLMQPVILTVTDMYIRW